MVEQDELEYIELGSSVGRDIDGNAIEEINVRLVLVGEAAVLPLWSSVDPVATERDLRRRMASDLQDFISESKFAWGNLRIYNF
jgi:hypothetical protein